MLPEKKQEINFYNMTLLEIANSYPLDFLSSLLGEVNKVELSNRNIKVIFQSVKMKVLDFYMLKALRDF